MSKESQQPTIIYDGECSFCQQQMDRIRKWDREGAFACRPRQDETVEQDFPALKQQDFNSGIRLVEPDGTVYVGADAIYHMTRRMPRWRWLAWIYRVPGISFLAKHAYQWVAANRHRFGSN